jgi:hypothetical protein
MIKSIYHSSLLSTVDQRSMSDGRQTPDMGGADQGAPGSAMPSMEIDNSKKPAVMLKAAFDDGALKVMEDEFQVERWPIMIM